MSGLAFLFVDVVYSSPYITKMKKKYIGTIAVCLAIACAGTFAVAHAFTDSTPKILGTTETVMSKDVMAAGSMKLVYLDEPAATDHLIYNLPPCRRE